MSYPPHPLRGRSGEVVGLQRRFCDTATRSARRVEMAEPDRTPWSLSEPLEKVNRRMSPTPRGLG